MVDNVKNNSRSKHPRAAKIYVGGDTPLNDAPPRLEEKPKATETLEVKAESALLHRRLLMQSAGWPPIPVKGKECHLPGWQTMFKVSAATIAKWETGRWSDYVSTGVVCGPIIGFDIDILNELAAKAVEALVREWFSKRGKILVRIGLPPKRLIPLRAHEPFGKKKIVLIPPEGKGEKDQGIEALGLGQMFVGFGPHPETGKPYEWHGGEPGNVKVKELPETIEGEIEELINSAIELLVNDHGYQWIEVKWDNKSPGDPGRPQEFSRVKAALAVLDSDEENLWFKVDDLSYDTDGSLLISARVTDPRAVRRPAFSVAAIIDAYEVDERACTATVTRARLCEISLVAGPCDRSALVLKREKPSPAGEFYSLLGEKMRILQQMAQALQEYQRKEYVT